MASLKRTNPATPAQTQVDRRRRQVAARPAGAATDEKTQTADAPSRATSGDRAPMAAADAPYNSSNLQAAVQHNADKEKEKAVEANLWTRVSTPCQTWRRSRLCCCHVEALARPVAQSKNSVEKEKASVMALLRHVHLPYSVASDEKLLETRDCLGTGGPAASRHRVARSDREEVQGGSLERNGPNHMTQ